MGGLWAGVATGENNQKSREKLMAGDDKKSKTPPKEKPPSKESTSVEALQKGKTPVEAPTKAEAKPEPATSSNYSRGEGQKPVSQAYKDNWNAIFARGKKKKR